MPDSTDSRPRFYEFFAGGGMARAGLTDGWRCLFANDFDQKKSEIYRANWGAAEMRTADIRSLNTSDLPDAPDLIWASFPCQDLSLAGGGAGLRGNRSGTFWPFWSLVKQLSKEGRAPKAIALENVCGTLSSHGGKDFAAICSALTDQGYLVGALVIDASYFVPQSRPRLFVVGVQAERSELDGIVVPKPHSPWHTRTLQDAHERLPKEVQERWVWWTMPVPARRNSTLADVLEESPTSVAWNDEAETQRLLSMMSPLHQRKIAAALSTNHTSVGAVYKRTRRDEFGNRVQRAEVRFDDIAGCLRTPAGGSSRQTLLIIDEGRVRSRLVSSRETARLMGLSDSYVLPDRYNQAYHLTGDGVVVHAVKYLSTCILLPIINPSPQKMVA